MHSSRRQELIGAARRRYAPGLVDLYAANLLETDRIVDRAIAGIIAQPAGGGWRELDRLLSGDGDRPAAPDHLQPVLERAAGTSWLDCERLERGAAIWWRAGLMMLPAMGHVLLEQDCFADIARPLLLNGRLVVDPARRIEETLQWVLAVTEPGAMRPGSSATLETLRISLLHGAMRNRLRRSADWDAAVLGPPISCTGMAHTTLAFAVEPVRAARQCGRRITDEEWADVLHLWRWIAHLMGVPDELMSEDVTQANEGYEICRDLFLDTDVEAPALLNAEAQGMIRLDSALPAPVARRVSARLRPYASRAFMAMGSSWHHPRLADVESLPRGRWSLAPTALTPIITLMDFVRRRVLRTDDLARARRNRATLAGILARIQSAPTAVAISELRLHPSAG